MKHNGRNVIRKHDKTDHGGLVISVSSGTIVFGVEAAVQGDMTFCPKCKGTFPIKSDGEGAKHAGNFYAYDSDMTACGAKIFSSL